MQAYPLLAEQPGGRRMFQTTVQTGTAPEQEKHGPRDEGVSREPQRTPSSL